MVVHFKSEVIHGQAFPNVNSTTGLSGEGRGTGAHEEWLDGLW